MPRSPKHCGGMPFFLGLRWPSPPASYPPPHYALLVKSFWSSHLLSTYREPGPLDKGAQPYFPGKETETPEVSVTCQCCIVGGRARICTQACSQGPALPLYRAAVLHPSTHSPRYFLFIGVSASTHLDFFVMKGHGEQQKSFLNLTAESNIMLSQEILVLCGLYWFFFFTLLAFLSYIAHIEILKVVVLSSSHPILGEREIHPT